MASISNIDISKRQQTTPLGDRIVQIGDWWASQKCVEEKSNRGVCIDKVHEQFNGRVIAEAYCVKFGYVCVQQACLELNIKNILPKTASAKGILDASMKIQDFVIRGINGIAPGTLFVRKSSGTGSGWHVGIVRNWNNDKFFTIEGNNGDRIGWFSYEWEEIPKKDFHFIQTHRMSETFQYVQKTVTDGITKIDKTVKENSLTTLALLGLVGYGVYKLAK